MTRFNFADCPECGADVRIRAKPFIGLRLTCSHCRSSLEVEQLRPVTLFLMNNVSASTSRRRMVRRRKQTGDPYIEE